ncbi:MAG: energy-coupling factor ABC transporter permease [Candidatus Bathyarchaeota archaeon]|nr:energy-coupling factor ABC transporter permease [Candidatus Bathyarchaeota archaeon]
MHIPDSFLIPPEICALMYAISLAFLIWSWKKAKATYTRSFAPILAMSSAFVFAAQMINFPIVYGTSGHLVGAIFLAALLGPHMAILGMTIVLMIQALVFADGGLLTFGANVFNMAVIGGISFFIVKPLATHQKTSHFLAGIFAASWLAVILGALACGIEVGFSPLFAEAGGTAVTVPAMLFWHTIIGLIEAIITTTILSQLHRLQPTLLFGITAFRGNPIERKP